MKEIYICTFHNNNDTRNICCADTYFKCLNYILYNYTYEDEIEQWKNETWKSMSITEQKKLYQCNEHFNMIKISPNIYLIFHKINYIE